MSTIGTYRLSVERDDPELTGTGLHRAFQRVFHSYGETTPRSELVKFRAAVSNLTTASTGKKKKAINPKRRLRGFLVEMQSDDARVAFVDNGQTILYDLPAEHLRKAGVTVKNQPFQMDEIEGQSESGGYSIEYRFLPLAKASDAEIEVLKFSEERKRKRDLIFNEFSKAKA
jgi:hypothetical protein